MPRLLNEGKFFYNQYGKKVSAFSWRLVTASLLFPLDLTQTTIPLFLTRWVTHLCAPSFVFLAGISAYLSLRRCNSKAQLSRHLLIRGLWLLILELTLVNFAWTFDPTFSFLLAGVLWAIGWSMVVLAALIHLPTSSVAAIGIFLMVFHNVLDPIQADQLGDWNWLWAVLHERKMFTLFQDRRFFLGYPLIPWIGVMAAGYAFGSVFDWSQSQRQQLLRRLGGGMIVAFIILRTLNFYGDPEPWSVQSNILYTLLSFVNCYKYPPSLLFLLMTLGPAILMLLVFERRKVQFLKPLVLFGQVPLFFYVLHLLLIHVIAILFALPKYGMGAITIPYLVKSLCPADYGYELPRVYALWLLIVTLLYPLCHWFATYRRKHKNWWLRYL
jgi:uncharacterized membrane protein